MNATELAPIPSCFNLKLANAVASYLPGEKCVNERSRASPISSCFNLKLASVAEHWHQINKLSLWSLCRMNAPMSLQSSLEFCRVLSSLSLMRIDVFSLE